MKLDLLNGPIPGESLTREPGNAPWEQPAQYSDPKDALGFYLEKFEDPEKIDDLLFLFDQGYPVSLMVETMLTMGVMEGIHTIDVSLIIGPIIHEYFVSLAKAAGIKVVEKDGPSDEEKKKMKQRQRAAIVMARMVEEDDFDDEDEVPSEMPEMPMGEAGPPSPPQGLVPRRM